MRRVEFYDGEGIDPDDDNLVGKLADRAAYRALREQIQTAVDDAGADAALLVRGADPSHSGTGSRTITLTNGLWCAAEDNPPAAASDAPEVYFGDSTGAAYVLDANTSGAVYRRDILQARIDAESTTDSEPRDFEDSATRALTTQAFNKRRVRTVTISVKKGTDPASEALADANEPAPDAGFVKIFSFLVDNTGTCSAAKRKRYTVGYRRRKRIFFAGVAKAVAGTVNLSGDALSLDDAAARAWLPFEVSSGRRIRQITVRTDPTLGDVVRLRLLRPVINAATLAVVTALSDASGAIQTIDTGSMDELAPSIADAAYVIDLSKTAHSGPAAIGAVVVTED